MEEAIRFVLTKGEIALAIVGCMLWLLLYSELVSINHALESVLKIMRSHIMFNSSDKDAFK
jgi:hypothetical protein